MDTLDAFALATLERLERRALRRTLVATDRGDFPVVAREGRRLLSFSCNDYLGLSRHPDVVAAAAAALARYGAGAGASRLVTGEHLLYGPLEARLAALKGTEAACVFGSGYLANIGVLGVLAGPEDLILLDEYAHACLNAGAQLSRAATERFAHNDVAQLGDLLARRRGAARHALIVTETVFSMDGDRAPLAELAELAARHDAWILTDDAHGLGVVAPGEAPVPLRMGTLSKAVGGYGGYCCASRAVVDLLKTRARSLVYSTGLPPATIAGASAALDIIASSPDLVATPLAKARRFTRALGLPEAQSAIVPLILGTPERALATSAALADAGFLVAAIRPPTVPEGTARLRFAFSALHPDAEIDRLARVLGEVLGTIAETSEREPCPASS